MDSVLPAWVNRTWLLSMVFMTFPGKRRACSSTNLCISWTINFAPAFVRLKFSAFGTMYFAVRWRFAGCGPPAGSASKAASARRLAWKFGATFVPLYRRKPPNKTTPPKKQQTRRNSKKLQSSGKITCNPSSPVFLGTSSPSSRTPICSIGTTIKMLSASQASGRHRGLEFKAVTWRGDTTNLSPTNIPKAPSTPCKK